MFQLTYLLLETMINDRECTAIAINVNICGKTRRASTMTNQAVLSLFMYVIETFLSLYKSFVKKINRSPLQYVMETPLSLLMCVLETFLSI